MPDEEGQASVEAALLLPVLMLCLVLLLQPACLLYTRTVMQGAAAEGCRLMATLPDTVGTAEQALKSYVLRRLGAVPDLPLFHEGGQQGWRIVMEGGSSEHSACVSVETSVRPLPLLGALASFGGQTDGNGGVVLKVEVRTQTRPGWLEGGFSEWSSVW